MKKVVLAAIFLLTLIFCASAFAAEGEEVKKKGASPTAYEYASPQAIFHRVSDWFATIGKSPEEKAKIKEERQAERETQRLQKQTQKTQRELEKTQEQKGKKFDMPMKGWQKKK